MTIHILYDLPKWFTTLNDLKLVEFEQKPWTICWRGSGAQSPTRYMMCTRPDPTLRWEYQAQISELRRLLSPPPFVKVFGGASIQIAPSFLLFFDAKWRRLLWYSVQRHFCNQVDAVWSCFPGALDGTTPSKGNFPISQPHRCRNSPMTDVLPWSVKGTFSTTCNVVLYKRRNSPSKSLGTWVILQLVSQAVGMLGSPLKFPLHIARPGLEATSKHGYSIQK